MQGVFLLGCILFLGWCWFILNQSVEFVGGLVAGFVLYEIYTLLDRRNHSAAGEKPR